MPMDGSEANPILYFDELGVGPELHVCESLAKHVCADMVQVEEWLHREKLLGLITPEGARAVEKLIEDLR